MRTFTPHGFRAAMRVFGPEPRIFIPPQVHDFMYHVVDLSAKEVSWLARVENPRDLDFIIGETFLFEQEVSATRAKITTDGLTTFAMQLLAEREDGEAVWNSIRLWGHSHVTMDTDPSKQDDDQMLEFSKCKHPWFIRLIANKLGRLEFTLYLFDRGIIIEDVPWQLLMPVDGNIRTSIQTELAAKVTVVAPPKGTARFLVVGDDDELHDPEEYGITNIQQLILPISARSSRSAKRRARRGKQGVGHAG